MIKLCDDACGWVMDQFKTDYVVVIVAIKERYRKEIKVILGGLVVNHFHASSHRCSCDFPFFVVVVFIHFQFYYPICRITFAVIVRWIDNKVVTVGSDTFTKWKVKSEAKSKKRKGNFFMLDNET